MNWIEEHRQVWAEKPSLRWFYETQLYAKILEQIGTGDTLEIGAGPGLFSGHHRCTVVTDIEDSPYIDQIADVHDLPFEDGRFSSVLGVDVFHHFSNPMEALRQIRRVLKPGGKMILIEPWTGFFGTLFYKHVHQEDCYTIENINGEVFGEGKSPMDGNATLPKTFFVHERAMLEAELGLRVITRRPFSTLSWVSTGGFTGPSTPLWLVKLITTLDKLLPSFVQSVTGLRAFYVVEAI